MADAFGREQGPARVRLESSALTKADSSRRVRAVSLAGGFTCRSFHGRRPARAREPAGYSAVAAVAAGSDAPALK